MKKIHLQTVRSTNDSLKALMLQSSLADFTCLSADSQTAGKGQRGQYWLSEPKKNVCLSVFKKFDNLSVNEQFKISMTTALALHELFCCFYKTVSVKWPNDIFVNGKKIGGILIETGVVSNQVSWAIIGIGLNVLQTKFATLPNATSLALEGHLDMSPNEIMEQLLPILEIRLENMNSMSFSQIKKEYETVLLGFETVRMFEKPGQASFQGVIKGVNHLGNIEIQDNRGNIDTYGLKEIRMLF